MKLSTLLITCVGFAPFWLTSLTGKAEDVKILHLDETQIATVQVSMHGTVISFPTKPSKVILGSAGTYGIEYVENDLAISPLKFNAQSHLFVYLLGRRFASQLCVFKEGG